MTASKSIWYPRYPGDYSRKTAHLSLAEHGAYALLMDYCYSNGGSIPANAVQVHRICRAFAEDEQAACMAVLHEFFELRSDGWHNERVDEEMLRRGDISEKRAKAARERHAKAHASAGANAGANAHTVTVTVTDIDGGDDAGASSVQNLHSASEQTTREQILASMGIGPDGVAGPSRFIGGQADMAEAERWAKLPGLTLNAICEEVRRVMASKRDGPPSSFKYFTRAMQELSGKLTAPQLEPIKGTKNDQRNHHIQHAQGGNTGRRSAHQVMFDAFQSVAAEGRSGAGSDEMGD